jgi:hypothetical protein
VLGVIGIGGWCCGGSQPLAETPDESASVAPAPPPPAPSARRALCTGRDVIVVVRRGPIVGSAPTQVITVCDGGAFRVEHGAEASEGKLESAEVSLLRNQVATADFRPPPPLAMRCQAVPTMLFVVEDPATGRSASFQVPCGEAPSRDVSDILTRVVGATRAKSPEAAE